MQKVSNKVLLVVITILVLIILGIITVVIYSNSKQAAVVNNFGDCAKAGYPVMESYPRQCRTPDGKLFVEDLAPINNGGSTTTSSAPAPVTRTVKVYFSKNPDSNNDFAATFSVNRDTTRTDVATFALEQLIAGPTGTEQSSGLFSPVKVSGNSTCNGKDFTIAISSGVATLRFCKQVTSAGIGDDARIKSTIQDTVKQFPTVNNVVILTKDDHCLGDESGLDQCKNI